MRLIIRREVIFRLRASFNKLGSLEKIFFRSFLWIRIVTNKSKTKRVADSRRNRNASIIIRANKTRSGTQITLSCSLKPRRGYVLFLCIAPPSTPGAPACK